MEPMLRLATLGRFALEAGGKALPTPPTKKARALLAHLVMHRGCDVSREQVLEIFWPEFEPSRARENLNVSLSSIRKSLRSGRLDPDTILVANRAVLRWIAAIDFDVDALERASGDPASPDAATLCEVYRGDFLEGDYDAWTVAERERIASIYERVLARAVAERKDAAAAEQLVGRNPYDEAAYIALIEAELQAGRIGAALAAAERARDALLELDVEPSPELNARLSLLQRMPLQAMECRMPFVARSSELALMRRRIRDALIGRGSVTLVRGEAGIGKSAFLARLAKIARDAGLALFQIRGEPHPQNDESAWGTTALRSTGAFDRPTLISVDDAHYMQGTSPGLLRDIVRATCERHCIVISVGLEGIESLRQLTQDVAVDELPLECLSARDVDSALRQALGVDIPDLAKALYARSDGHPQYLVEMLDVLVRSGKLQRGDRTWKLSAPLDDGDLPLPASLRTFVEAQLSACGPVAAGIAAALATAPPATGDELRCALSIDETSFLDAIDELLVRGLLRQASSGAALTFAHAVVAEVARGTINPARRKRLHAELARCVALGRATGSFERAARHLAAAEQPIEAAGAYLSAATEAIARGASDDAMLFTRTAIDLVRDCARTSEREVLLGRLHRRLAVAHLMHFDAQASAEAATVAVDTLRACDAGAHLTSALLTRAFAYDWLARPAEQLADAQEVCERASCSTNNDVLARAMVEASSGFRFMRDRKSALQFAARAHDLARASRAWQSAAVAAIQAALVCGTWWDFSDARDWIAIAAADAPRAGMAEQATQQAALAAIACLLERFNDASRALEHAGELRTGLSHGLNANAQGFTVANSRLFEEYVHVVLALLRGSWLRVVDQTRELEKQFRGNDNRLTAALALLRLEALFQRDGECDIGTLREALDRAAPIANRQWLAGFAISYELANACVAVRTSPSASAAALRTALDVCEARAQRAPMESDRAFALLAKAARQAQELDIARRALDRSVYYRRRKIVAAGTAWGGDTTAGPLLATAVPP